MILVAHADTTRNRLFDQFADDLAEPLGVRPSLTSVTDLFTVLYRLGADRKVLVVVDEFLYLLGTTERERNRALSSIQAVIERERDTSEAKVILAGSLVAEMERLQQSKSPLYGRLRPLDVRPLSFTDASDFLEGGPLERLTRFAVTGGMPRYLEAFGTGSLRKSVVSGVLDRRSGLFDEPAALLRNELRSPATYFDILEALSAGVRPVGDVGSHLGLTSADLTRYLSDLQEMRLVERITPVGSDPNERKSLWRCNDNFVRFWFRFVRPYQDELEAGADPAAYYQHAIEPFLADHAAPVFEAEVRRWVRTEYAGPALRVGGWWGKALDAERRAKRRSTEEIDAVGLGRGKRVLVVAEAKWTNKPLGADVVNDLNDFKLPALAQAGFNVSDLDVVLASRSGFTDLVREAAELDDRIRLVDAETILA